MVLLSSFCFGYQPEQASIGQITQKAKPTAIKTEEIVLKPVVFQNHNESIISERQALEEAQAAILANAELLGKRADFEMQLGDVRENLQIAQEAYDNLAGAVMIMKEDLKELRAFKHFDPNAHDDKTPEIYLNILTEALEAGDRNILGAGISQITAAQSLLARANENLATVRADLERINREMLSLQ